MTIRAQAIESDEGPSQGVLMALVDVTDQRLSEQRMFHADKMRTIGQLTSGITHDFNNILSISTLTVSQMQKPDRDRGRDEERITRLAKANELATSMIKRLLLTAGPQSAQPGVIDANQIIEDVGDLLEKLLSPRIEIELDLSAEDPFVLIDEARAQQVLLNLAQNAADAMGGQGGITVRTANGGGDEQNHRDHGFGYRTRHRSFGECITVRALRDDETNWGRHRARSRNHVRDDRRGRGHHLCDQPARRHGGDLHNHSPKG